MPEGSVQVVERFYEVLWNRWALSVVDEVLAEGVHFRGTLNSTLQGREAFKVLEQGAQRVGAQKTLLEAPTGISSQTSRAWRS
jgi:hypothetical protein